MLRVACVISLLHRAAGATSVSCAAPRGHTVPVPAGYDLGTPPSAAQCSASPTLVVAELYVTKLHSIDERSEYLMLEGYFRLRWHDDRLVGITEQQRSANCRSTSGEALRYPTAAGLWVPDVYFINALQANYGSEASAFAGEIPPPHTALATPHTDLQRPPFSLTALPLSSH
jgi:hypothetical protein